MAGYPVVFVDAGGLPVTYGSDGNGWPIEEALSGLPVTIVAAGGLPVVEGVGGFSLDAYIASLSDGLYFDTTKTDRFFQENTGPTLADDVGEAMGLALDQRTWGGKTLAEVLAVATNMGGTGFSMSANGGTGTATESPSGQLNLTGDGTNAATGDKAYTTVAGATYEVTFTVGATAVNARAGTSQFGTSLTGGNLTGAVGANRFFFTATGTTSWLGFAKSSAALAVVTGVSVKLVPGNHGAQATGTLKPVRQASVAKFDGWDDNWLTPYLAGAGSNFVVALVTVPASVPAFQYIFGSTDGNRFGVGVNPDGTVGFAAGSTSPITAKGTTDIRNVESVIGMSCDGANVLGFVGAAQEYAGALVGSLNTTTPVRVGAINGSGSANSFYGGAVKKLVAGRDVLSFARYQQIRNALLAA